MVLGVLVGYLCNKYAQNAQEAKQIASYFSLITDIFLRMIKMIIAPLVFATLVSGLASMSDASAVGRIGLRAMFWFITASAISLLLGLMLVNVFQPGAHLNLALPDTSLTSGLKTGDFTSRPSSPTSSQEHRRGDGQQRDPADPGVLAVLRRGAVVHPRQGPTPSST